MLFSWMRQRIEAAKLVRADAEALLLAAGRDAYAAASQRERFSLVGARVADERRGRAHWKRVAATISKMDL